MSNGEERGKEISSGQQPARRAQEAVLTEQQGGRDQVMDHLRGPIDRDERPIGGSGSLAKGTGATKSAIDPSYDAESRAGDHGVGLAPSTGRPDLGLLGS